MSFSERFDIGYLKIAAESGEEVFLSVTPSMRLGPGIQRDGVTPPRMTDPHTVRFVVGQNGHAEDPHEFPPTTNAYVQRAGTWTLFDHVRHFVESRGQEYRIIGVQSCGDLTMNPWHVALAWEDGQPVLYHLATPGDPEDIHEPLYERTYRCLVKWKPGVKPYMYEFLDLKFHEMKRGFGALLVDTRCDQCPDTPPKDVWITDDIEFALAGKPIVQKGRDISLANVIDQFQDVRHVFNVPTVPVHDLQGGSRGVIQFGECILFKDLNARRGALTAPIIVDLNIADHGLSVKLDQLSQVLQKTYHYRISPDSPTRRGEFRKYSDSAVEIFYPHNVYPFGVLGGTRGRLVCLASGGLSGRVGNTLEGIIRIMYDFFGCEDAIVLDEGYDTFHILNPNIKQKETDPDNYAYSNDEVLRQVASFTRWRLQEDAKDCEVAEAKKKDPKDKYKLGANMREWPLNRQLFKDMEAFCEEKSIDMKPPKDLDVMAVEPRRSQMRAALIFAVKESSLRKKEDGVGKGRTTP